MSFRIPPERGIFRGCSRHTAVAVGGVLLLVVGQRMSWSYRIARIAGIDIKIHVTFLLLLAWVGYTNYQRGGEAAAISGIIFILFLFLCVLLHEFGHAFAARAYGIRTPDITLLPIGGVARLERMPEKPFQEFVVAIAGPAVNVVIIGILMTMLPMSALFSDKVHGLSRAGSGMMLSLLQVNIMLVQFNLIPAFPMDGGRVFRALLATRLSYTTATRIAARVGQGIAILFVAAYVGVAYLGIRELSWADNPFMLLIAMFVFTAAQQELAFVEYRQKARGGMVSDVMITQFARLQGDLALRDAVDEMKSKPQAIYPVVDGQSKILGLITSEQILKEAEDQPFLELASLVHLGGVIPENTPVQQLMAQIPENQRRAIFPVVNTEGQLVGLLVPEQLP